MRKETLAHTGFLLGQQDDLDAVRLLSYKVYAYTLSEDVNQSLDAFRQIQAQLPTFGYVTLLKKLDAKPCLFVHLFDNDAHPPEIGALKPTLITDAHHNWGYYLSVYLRLLFREAMCELGFTKTFKDVTFLTKKPIEDGQRALDLWTIDCRVDFHHNLTPGTFQISFFRAHESFIRFDPAKHQQCKMGALFTKRFDAQKRRHTYTLEPVKGPFKDEPPQHATLYIQTRYKSKRIRLDFLNTTNYHHYTHCWTYHLDVAMTAFIQKAAQYGVTLTRDVKTFIKLEDPSHDTASPHVLGVHVEGVIKLHVLDRRSQIQQKRLPAESWIQAVTTINKYLKGVELTFEILDEANLQGESPLPTESLILVLLDQDADIENDPYAVELQAFYPTQHIITRPADEDIDTFIRQGVLQPQEDSKRYRVDNPAMYFDFELTAKDYEKHAMRLAICIKELLFKRAVRQADTDYRRLLPSIAHFLNGHTFFLTEVDKRGLFFMGTDQDGQGFAVQVAKRVMVPNSRQYHLEIIPEGLEVLNHSVRDWVPADSVRHPLDVVLDAIPMPNFKKTQESVFNRLKGKKILWHQDDKGVLHLLMFSKNVSLFMLPTNAQDVEKALKCTQTQFAREDWRIEMEAETLVAKLKPHLAKTTTPEQILDIVSVWNAYLQSEDAPPELSFTELFKNIKNKITIGHHWRVALSHYFAKPLTLPRSILQYPGKDGIWMAKQDHPQEALLYISSKDAMQQAVSKQGSWHEIQILHGSSDIAWLSPLFSVEWVRLSQFAGNPCLSFLTRQFADRLCPLPKGEEALQDDNDVA